MDESRSSTPAWHQVTEPLERQRGSPSIFVAGPVYQ
jgi:hypothetical protein